MTRTAGSNIISSSATSQTHTCMQETAAMQQTDLYEQSTQFKDWTFTKTELSALRSQCNTRAIEAVRKYVRDEACMSVGEEYVLVLFYSLQIEELARQLQFPSYVKVSEQLEWYLTVGTCCSLLQAILSSAFNNGLSSSRYHAYLSLSGHEDRESLHTNRSVYIPHTQLKPGNNLGIRIYRL